jgi:3',5'-cyclic AMP phosphodiesterase CpdA
MNLSRREFIRSAAALALTPTLGGLSAPEAESFSFAHFTDIHIEPEKRAAVGSAACFDRLNSLEPEFALCGGDLVFDAAESARSRGIELFDLYAETSRRISPKVYSVPGNHDVFGLSNKSGILASDPLYGKKMFEDRIGQRFSSFEHKGWHFLLLDSIGTTPQREFIGLIDEDQLAWLRTELRSIGPIKPIIVMTHVPLLSAVLQIVPDPWKTASTYLVTNSQEVLGILRPYNVKAVLQGHTHICENVIYNGCQFLTSGAVCGNWWKGPRCGHPEGFAMVTVKGGSVSWRYETYGFVASRT